MYICIYIYMCLDVYLYIYTYIYIFIFICTHINRHPMSCVQYGNKVGGMACGAGLNSSWVCFHIGYMILDFYICIYLYEQDVRERERQIQIACKFSKIVVSSSLLVASDPSAPYTKASSRQASIDKRNFKPNVPFRIGNVPETFETYRNLESL